ncbi:NADPH-dependent F420 reductase [Actinomycetospora straminea]|uniref:NAD(P)-binding domain-containing protein n=1 Tax=Actinomycetospora straminea TaxID=663607 RepID=A0ABP9EGJ2_9PSEU|nr:NAD(P)-binding domain-containing protein [Actinomycetospora straminea]MDD7935663.1 NAD(P)-binding domain-containing protein [Actinomycetospora straminea]
MRIGIIGTGLIGATLTRRLTALGHEVRVANSRAPETLAELAAETGATPVWARDAAADADVVVVSVLQKSTPDLGPGVVAGAKEGAPVIETNNYYPRQRDGRIDALEDGTPESVWVAEQLGTPVYKAFNGIHWKHLLERGAPRGAAGRIALPVAGANGPAKDTVMALVDELGFDPVDAGPLEESWRQQPGTPVYGADLDADGVRRALAAASPERPSDFRAA